MLYQIEDSLDYKAGLALVKVLYFTLIYPLF